MRLVFFHGWALGPDIWDGLARQLAGVAQARADLGYFGPAAMPEPLPGDILVGHSLGLLEGLCARDDWAGAVAINAFSRFCRNAEGRGCGPLAGLRAMQGALRRDADACVQNFRATIGAPPPPRAGRADALAQGLARLRDFDADTRLPKNFLTLAAAQDPLVPVEESERLNAIAGGILALAPLEGHGLPWTAPEFCAAHIMDFLSRS